MAHGELIDGVWHTRFHDTKKTGGRFQRGQPKFRNWVTADGSAGPSGTGGFAAARGRYHLYVSLACPWAHRTVIFRKLKGLEDVISMAAVISALRPSGAMPFETMTASSPISRRTIAIASCTLGAV